MEKTVNSVTDAAVRALCEAIRDGVPFEEARELPEVWAATEAGLLDIDAIKDWWM